MEPVSLVHELQHHDELTHDLVHWATLHSADTYRFRGRDTTGGELAETIRAELRPLTGRRGRLQPRLYDQRHRLHDGVRHRRHPGVADAG